MRDGSWSPAPWLAALLLAAVGALGGAPGAGAERPSLPGPAYFHSSFHGNVSIAGTGPDGAVPVQSNLTVTFEMRVPTYGPQLAGLYIRFPSPEVTFNTSTGPVSFFFFPKNVAIDSANWSAPRNTTFNILLPQATTFTGGVAGGKRTAVLTSQTLALTSPLPFGSLTVWVRWSWNLTPSIGTIPVNSSGWIPGTNGTPIVPDQYVAFSAAHGLSVAPGETFSGCVDGATAGRTFSLHAETVRPFDDFVQANVTVPASQVGPYCWGVAIPSYLPPQSLLVHLWDYANGPNGSGNVTSFLLYSLNVAVVPVSAPPPPWYSGTLPWELGGIAAAAVTAAAVGAWFGRRRRAPPRTVPSAAPAGPVDGGARPPPRAPR